MHDAGLEGRHEQSEGDEGGGEVEQAVERALGLAGDKVIIYWGCHGGGVTIQASFKVVAARCFMYSILACHNTFPVSSGDPIVVSGKVQ